jgi:hypothetical protein
MSVVDQLDMTPRLAGRAPKGLSVDYVRDIGAADIALLATERSVQPSTIKRLRDRHHQLARCLAQGMSNAEASAITGYDPSRISILKGDPTFQELLELYREHENVQLAEFQRRASTVTLTALENLQDILEDEENPATFDQNLAAVKTLADRTGHAPIARSVNTQVNVELGTRLSQARARLAAIAPPAPILDADFSEVRGDDGADGER